MKKVIIIILVILATLSGFLYLKKSQSNIGISSDYKFTGKLEKVDTGCFADGECYVEVSGKHITVLMGWTNDTVGKIIGSESIGDLEKHIGENIEVYAKNISEERYTLYGSQDYYIKLLGK